MTINALIQSTRLTLTDTVERFRADRYFVDNSFQRRLVWTERQKVRLIETILTGFPMPEIYLWEQQIDPESGQQRHSIVDGQQRVTTVVQFVSNEWPLRQAYLDESNRNSDFSDKSWVDLGDERKQSLWNYIISARTIPRQVEDANVRAIFRRLNETDKSLNPQEFRNADFQGEFIKAAEAVADDPRWKKWEVFKEPQIRRMADMELASSLLIACRSGVVGENTKSVNEIYDLYNDEYEEKDQDIALITNFLTRADEHYLVDVATRSFFTKPIHIYTLFCVDMILGGQLFADKLDSFVTAYQNQEDDPNLDKYRIGSSSRTRSGEQRNRRVDGLRHWIATR
jgi:uncharacterized protein with ParB-like and HNH nuclease domain